MSPTATTQRGPWRTRSLRRTEKKIGSIESTSCTMIVRPKRTASSRSVVSFWSCWLTRFTVFSPEVMWRWSHDTAWVDGSMMYGVEEADSITMAFSTESWSAGRPSAFHSSRCDSTDMKEA